MVKHRPAEILVGTILSLIFLSGCGIVATRTKFHKPITADLLACKYEKAAAKIEKAKAEGKYERKDRLLYYLDSGAIYHYAAEPDSSNARLSTAEDAADELFTKSISRAAGSMVLNDNLLEYSGEDHEILYANLLMALNYLSMDKFDDAFVEIRRAGEKLDLLEAKYDDAAREFNEQRNSSKDSVRIDYAAARVRFNNDAFARYLSMKIYAAEGMFDDARIDSNYLDEAFLTQPDIYDFDMPEVKIAPDSGVLLSVVALAGLSPVKEALNLRIRTDKDLDLVQVLYTDSEHQDVEYGHLPIPVSEDYYFKFAIPKLVPRESEIARIRVYVDSNPAGELQLIEDISRVAGETFKAKSSLIYLKSVARAVAKGMAAHKVKKKADTGGVGGWLKKAAVDVATDISENADLRCARYLPGRVYVKDLDIMPGIHDIEVRFMDSRDAEIGREEYPNIEIKADGLNLIEAFCPR